MAITVGTITSSGDQTATWAHNCATDTTILVVVVRTRDTVQADCNVTGITFNSVALSEAYSIYDATFDFGVEIWYLINPSIGSYNVVVSFGGTVSDHSSCAIDLKGTATTSPIDKTGTVVASGREQSCTLTGAATGSMHVCGLVIGTNAVGNYQIKSGNGSQADEVDMGSYCGSAGYRLENGSGVATIVWESGDLSTFYDFATAGVTFKPGTGNTTLTVSDTVHSHTADGPVSLTQVHTLAGLSDGAHGHTADGPFDLTEHKTLTGVSDGAHGHTADGPFDITQISNTVLVVDDAVHGHTADGPIDITQAHTLAGLSDGSHGHTADGPLSLTQQHLLVVDDTSHGHVADGAVLDVGSTLVVDDAVHGHTADGPFDLLQNYLLVVDDAVHSHTSDDPFTLAQQHLLTVDDTIHSHLADDLFSLVQQHTLMVDDCWHGHSADGVSLSGSEYTKNMIPISFFSYLPGR